MVVYPGGDGSIVPTILYHLVVKATPTALVIRLLIPQALAPRFQGVTTFPVRLFHSGQDQRILLLPLWNLNVPELFQDGEVEAAPVMGYHILIRVEKVFRTCRSGELVDTP